MVQTSIPKHKLRAKRYVGRAGFPKGGWQRQHRRRKQLEIKFCRETTLNQNQDSSRPVPGTESISGGFTLLELLVVVAIISMLIGFLGVLLTGTETKAKVASTQNLIHQLEGGIKNYQSTMGTLPQNPITLTGPAGGPLSGGKTIGSGNQYDSQVLHACLRFKLLQPHGKDPVTDEVQTKEVGPFVEANLSDHIDGDVDDPRAPITDAWRKRLGFRSSASYKNPSNLNHATGCKSGSQNNQNWVDIWSRGPDQKTGTSGIPGCDEDDVNNFGNK